MHTSRRPRRFATVVAAAAVIFAACGDDSGGDTDEGAADPDEAADQDDDEADEADEADGGEEGSENSGGEPVDPSAVDLDEDATLRYGFYISLSTFDPHLTTGSQDNTWLYPVYDRLVHTNAAAEPQPGLATDWEFSDDGSYLEMQLREGVEFHDGEPFNAQAVKANIERAQNHPRSSLVHYVEHIDRIEAVDGHTVRFHTEYPDASLPLTLSDRAGIMVSPAAFENDDLATQPVGAGAYEVTDYVVEDVATYERFEDYWDVENTHLAGIEIHTMVSQDTRFNALRSGQIDAAELEADQIDQIESSDLSMVSGEDVSFGLLQFNDELHEAFEDERVRRAISHAIDRESIAEGIFRGYASPTSQIYPEGYFAHDPDTSADHYEYDPDRARELLEEAGYGDGFSFEIVTTTTPQRVQTSEVIQQNLAEIGIEVEIRQIEGGGPFLEEVYGNEAAESWMLMWGGRPDPSLTAEALFTAESYNNPSGLTSDAVEEMVTESKSALDEGEREDVLQELSTTIVDENLSVVPLYFPEKIGVHNDRVEGMQIWTVGRPEFRGMGITPE